MLNEERSNTLSHHDLIDLEMYYEAEVFLLMEMTHSLIRIASMISTTLCERNPLAVNKMIQELPTLLVLGFIFIERVRDRIDLFVLQIM